MDPMASRLHMTLDAPKINATFEAKFRTPNERNEVWTYVFGVVGEENRTIAEWKGREIVT